MSFLGAVLAELFPRSSRRHMRLSTIAFVLLFTGALGTSTAVAVAASPACSQFVHTYVDRLKRNVVSSSTLRRWHEWGVRHPNWHPGLNAPKRPKFKKVREEKFTGMQLECPVITPEISLLAADLGDFLLPIEAPAFQQALNTPSIAPIQSFQTPIGSPSAASIGPIAAGGIGGGAAPIGSTPTSGGPIATSPVASSPISDPVPITPVAPVTPAPVPEPNSIVLTLTGMAALIAVTIFRRRQPEYRHSC